MVNLVNVFPLATSHLAHPPAPLALQSAVGVKPLNEDNNERLCVDAEGTEREWD
jgi:hypothetical protein